MWRGYEDLDKYLVRMLVGAVLGALVVGVVWLGQWTLTRETEPSPSEIGIEQSTETEPRAETGALAGSSAPADSGATHLERCQEVYAAQGEPLQAAAASLEQWEVHIGAMNKLVTGAITLRQAWQFWNQTRVGASRRLEDFATADRRFYKRTARCPDPGRSPEVSPALNSCHRAVAERNRTLRLARVALQTWKVHVRHMNMLRRGEMTPEEATRLWLQNWRKGNREVRAYRAAARTAEVLSC